MHAAAWKMDHIIDGRKALFCHREHHGMRSGSKQYSSDVCANNVPCMSCIGLATNRFLALRWFRFRWWAGTHDGAVRISDENELMFTFAY